jgi:hypothetical protein
MKVFTGMKGIKGMITTKSCSRSLPEVEFGLSDSAGMGYATQSRLLEITYASSLAMVRPGPTTEVLNGSNFCHTFLILFIPFIPVPNPFSASR